MSVNNVLDGQATTLIDQFLAEQSETAVARAGSETIQRTDSVIKTATQSAVRVRGEPGQVSWLQSLCHGLP